MTTWPPASRDLDPTPETAAPAAKQTHQVSEKNAEACSKTKKVAGPPDEASVSADEKSDRHCLPVHPHLAPDTASHDQKGQMALNHEQPRI